MQFSVIYDISAYFVSDIPSMDEKLWEMTQGENEPSEKRDDGYGHYSRKWCAVLSKPQLEEFIMDQGLYMDTTETMGMIGAPGFENPFAWVPAHSFNSLDGSDFWGNAYVCPIPDVRTKSGTSNRPYSWDRIKHAMLKKYGSDGSIWNHL